jgi:hypothetical protein
VKLDKQSRDIFISLLRNYETAWQRDAAFEALLDYYPMPDGTRGIPRWREILESWIASPEGSAAAHDKFEPLYKRIEDALEDSELEVLLRDLPPISDIH